jgi:long-subunit acyl-CoA synthetase (AMP-forming)
LPQSVAAVCLNAPHISPAISLTYQEVANQIKLFATGLQSLRIQPGRALAKPLGTRIALFADNSPRWLIADRGIMSIGAFNIPISREIDCQISQKWRDKIDRILLNPMASDYAQLNPELQGLGMELMGDPTDPLATL